MVEEHLRCGLECGEYKAVDQTSGECGELIERGVPVEFADVKLGERCYLSYKKSSLPSIAPSNEGHPFS